MSCTYSRIYSQTGIIILAVLPYNIKSVSSCVYNNGAVQYNITHKSKSFRDYVLKQSFATFCRLNCYDWGRRYQIGTITRINATIHQIHGNYLRDCPLVWNYSSSDLSASHYFSRIWDFSHFHVGIRSIKVHSNDQNRNLLFSNELKYLEQIMPWMETRASM